MVQIKTIHRPRYHPRTCAFTRFHLCLGGQGAVLPAEDSLPVSTMWQWCVSRFRNTVVILASPNTLDHSEKLRLVVMTTLVCSYTRIAVTAP